MFGLGFWEIAIILAVALLVLGPSKLPELAKGLGKGLREFRKATEDFKSTIEDEVYKPEPPKQVVASPQPAAAPVVDATPVIEEKTTSAEILPAPAAVVTADPIKDNVPVPSEPKSPSES